MRIFGKNIQSTSFWYGVAAMALVLVVPVVSKPVADFLAGVRDKIGGMSTK